MRKQCEKGKGNGNYYLGFRVSENFAYFFGGSEYKGQSYFGVSFGVHFREREREREGVEE